MYFRSSNDQNQSAELIYGALALLAEGYVLYTFNLFLIYCDSACVHLFQFKLRVLSINILSYSPLASNIILEQTQNNNIG